MDDGFEYRLPGDEKATAFEWKLNVESTPHMRLIDHFAQVPIDVFLETLDDDLQKRRTNVLLSVIATSIESKFPEWSLERIIRIVEKYDWSQHKEIEGDDASPPEEGSQEPTSEDSTKPSDMSSPSATPAAT